MTVAVPTEASSFNRSNTCGMRPEREEDRDDSRDRQFHRTFRITGAASVARLEPLLLARDWNHSHRVVWSRASDGSDGDGGAGAGLSSIDFVWETTVSKLHRMEHRSARVLNRLSGAQVRTTVDIILYYCPVDIILLTSYCTSSSTAR